MDDADRVLAECAANPDDDAPRLVWADLVGGERGELVVIQCDLARGDLSPAETRKRRIRENELLDRYAVAWAGPLAHIAQQWSFRRGFIEAARFDWMSSVSAWPWPLMRSISFESWRPVDLIGIDHIRALGIGRLPDDGLPRLPGLRALAIDGLEDAHARNVLDVIASAPIETLRLRRQRLYDVPVARLIEAADRLVALEMTSEGFENPGIVAAAQKPLRALRLGNVRMHELTPLAHGAIAATLEHLAFDLLGGSTGLDALLARFPRLRSLEVTNTNLDDPRMQPHAANELVHEAPSAMGHLGTPWLAWSEPAVFARVDRPEIFDVPKFPAYERIMLGRSMDNPVRLMSSMVARRHAALQWREGAHEIVDLNSTNGIVFGTSRIERRRLADGDELILGDVILRYFVGEGARDRAVAAASAPSTP